MGVHLIGVTGLLLNMGPCQNLSSASSMLLVTVTSGMVDNLRALVDSLMYSLVAASEGQHIHVMY